MSIRAAKDAWARRSVRAKLGQPGSRGYGHRVRGAYFPRIGLEKSMGGQKLSVSPKR